MERNLSTGAQSTNHVSSLEVVSSDSQSKIVARDRQGRFLQRDHEATAPERDTTQDAPQASIFKAFHYRTLTVSSSLPMQQD